ncbi:hemerythrin domain-containing protein [Dokdonella sp.]|jgi:hemerythrin|uniref:hemerythrin domain-containing protein n=1 Tax=Dokdonella sp. TaxID=2291710 RepID=UPI002DD64FC3|nr:hemerythrin domain-containing protein [Dokdonella sp.]
MAAMEWTDKLALGLEPMDKTHVEFVDAYNRLLNVSGAELLAAMDAFIEHSVEHFEQENAWMAKIGFPGCHKAEHDRVLAVCRDVRKRMERGDAAIGRQLIQEMPLWFDNHVATMDAALSSYIESIGFDTETGEVRSSPEAGCEDGLSACCTPPTTPELPQTQSAAAQTA